MSLVVQKYGGSSLAKAEQIKSLAQNIADLHHQGRKLIIVVSAMGRTTDQLVDLAYEVSSTPNRRELDMLLTTGERVSMSLMSMALSDLNCPAISFTGSQAGVFTDSSHSNARITAIKPVRVEQALSQGQVVVLAGFQGVHPEKKEITTLGRGGSDTTAVAMAAHFNAEICQILKDVEGVCSTDPTIVSKAKHLPHLSYDSLIDMAFWGAKVLHYRSVVLAKKLGVPLFVGMAKKPTVGTTVSKEVNMYENECILSVNSHAEVHHYGVKSANMQESLAYFKKLLNDNGLPWPQLLASAHEDGQTRIMLTAAKETLLAIANASEGSKEIAKIKEALSSVTTTCHGQASPELPSRILSQLKSAGVEVEKLISHPLSVTVFIPQADREKAVRTLHQLVD